MARPTFWTSETLVLRNPAEKSFDQGSLTVVRNLCFGRGDHPDPLQEPSVVPPFDPLQGSDFDVVEPVPRLKGAENTVTGLPRPFSRRRLELVA